MKYKLDVYDIYEFGQRTDSAGNPHQEDSIFPAYGKATDSDRLFILCDGMGGHDAGEVASAAVCDSMSRSILGSEPDPQGAFTAADLEQAVAAAFDNLDSLDSGAAKKMGTTMTMLKLYQGGACVAHMGDSRVYQIRPGETPAETRIVFRTMDHSLVNDLIKIGEITPEEALHHPKKNVITRAMQPHMSPRPRADVKWLTDIQAGDYFYMCSDGMLEQMTDQQICYHFSRMAGDDSRKISNLIASTQENRDNHSAIIVHVTEVTGEPVGVPAGVVAPKPLVSTVSDTPAQRPAPQPAPQPAQQAGAPFEPQGYNESPEKKSGKSIILTIVTILVVAAVGLGIYWLAGNTSKEKEPEKKEKTQENPGDKGDAKGKNLDVEKPNDNGKDNAGDNSDIDDKTIERQNDLTGGLPHDDEDGDNSGDGAPGTKPDPKDPTQPGNGNQPQGGKSTPTQAQNPDEGTTPDDDPFGLGLESLFFKGDPTNPEPTAKP